QLRSPAEPLDHDEGVVEVESGAMTANPVELAGTAPEVLVPATPVGGIAEAFALGSRDGVVDVGDPSYLDLGHVDDTDRFVLTVEQAVQARSRQRLTVEIVGGLQRRGGGLVAGDRGCHELVA